MSVGEEYREHAGRKADWRSNKRLVQVHIDRDVATVLNDRAHRDGVPKGSIVNDALRRLFGGDDGDGRRSRTA